jgi:phage-related protein
MAEGTVLAELALQGDRQFRRAVERAGESMDDAGGDATSLSFMLGRAAGALENVRSDAVGTSGALSLLQGRADEAGDELGGLGRSGVLAAAGLTSASGSATSASGTFSALTVSTNGLALSFGGLTTSLVGVAALLGTTAAAATVLVSALVPLTATLGGLATAAGALAGAFGAVIGSGALAYGQQLTDQYQDELTAVRQQIEEYEELRDVRGELTDSQRERLRQLKQEEQRLDDVEGPLSALQVRLGELGSELSGIVAEWGGQFAPLIRDAINAIPQLVRNVLNAVGGMDRFADALRAFGQEAFRTIPAVASTLADLAREALPLVIDGMQWLRQNGGGIFDSIMATTRRVAPMVQDVGSALVDALPSINRFGIAVLNQALPAIESGIRGFGNLLDQIMAFTQTQQFEQIMGALRDGARELKPEFQELKQNIGDLIDTVIENGPALIRGFTAVADSVLDIVNALTPVITAFIDLLGGAAEAWADWTERSEQQEQNLAEQGIAGYVGSGTLDMLQNSVPQSAQAQTRDELRVVVDLRDDMLDARVDDQIRRDSRQQADLVDRGGFRGD